MKSAAEEKLIASADKNTILGIYNFCERHKMLPRLSKDKKRWILRPTPKTKAPVYQLFDSRD